MNKEDFLKLRERTGAGMNSCKLALEEADGDIDIAYEYLRLLSQPVARYKMKDGVKMRWEKDDYLKAASIIVKSQNSKDL